ncbi:acyl-CoA/acyl-ACP dehydrogenase [Sphingomonas naphthae]|uniref:Acyl-CoA/acyl-ACP dehydrogenase n=1 Tax=Sphingomonas naphthae TaxID=1813468 RepID=A0ABY7TGX9_9SPHN|nr:acyl-CoA dehydrogenase family protein [Sphingomonas naphthae]WCT72195.1 acyl-CoA/acyl-ACP dehydrogenase [Sphingomonas naphthae]
MNFNLSDDNLALRDAAADFLTNEIDLAPLLVPGSTADAIDRESLWAKVAGLGWPALAVPESAGGLGMSLLDLVMVVGEIGRTVAPVALLGTLAGTWAITAAGSDEQRDRLLGPVAAGQCRLALAAADATGFHGAIPSVRATPSADGYILEGESHFVVDAPEADRIVCIAVLDGERRAFVVDADAAGLAVEQVDWRDITRKVAIVRFSATPAERLEGGWDAAWPDVRDRLYLYLAAESAAGSHAVLDEAVEYAKQRRAFGKPIGQFQAIKHQLAEIAGQVELADVGVQYAAWALDNRDPRASLAAAMAQAYASDTYRNATHRNIQVFGAIGFTWEMKNHLFYKRARCNAALLGESAHQHEEVVAMLEAEAA